MRSIWALFRSSARASAKGKEGQTLTLDFVKGVVTVQETGESYPCEALGEQAMKILAAGGIKPLMRARFAKEKRRNKKAE